MRIINEAGEGLAAQPRNYEAVSKLLQSHVDSLRQKPSLDVPRNAVMEITPADAEALSKVYFPDFIDVCIKLGKIRIIGDEVNA
jgi:hypothetical protein